MRSRSARGWRHPWKIARINLAVVNDIMDAVELKSMERRATYIREPNSMMQCGIGESPHGAIYLIEKVFAQSCLALFIPDRGLERVLLSERKPFDDETHAIARAPARWFRPKAPAVQAAPEPIADDE